MVGAAQRGEVAGAGGAAVAVGAAVVEVATSGASGAEREHALRPRQHHLLANGLGGDVAADAVVVVEVQDRADGDRGGGAAPAGDLVEQDVGAGGAELGDLGVGHQDRDVDPATGAFGEVEGELGAADLAGGHRPADVEGQVGHLADLRGDGGDGSVEVECVAGVHESFDPGEPVDAGGMGADVEPAGVGVPAALHLLGVVEGAGLLDGALELAPRQRVRERRERAVDERGAVERQRHRGLGDLERPPGRDLAVEDPLPEPREPVLGLEGLAEPVPAGRIGLPEGDDQLHHRHLANSRRAVAGEQQLTVAVVGERDVVAGAGVDQVLLEPVGDRRRAGRPRPSRTTTSAARTSASDGGCAVVVMGQLKHSPPTLRPENQAQPQASRSRIDNVASAPPGVSQQDRGSWR